MKLLVDMNLSPRWVEFLRTNGFDADHWSTVGDGRATDREIMAFAARQGHVVLTQDLDFSAILAASNMAAPSVVQIRAGNISPEAIGARLVAALQRMAPELAQGTLVTVDIARDRVRVLPLRPGD